MAAKKPTPKKFKQARKDAKSAAKQTFSGKPQARLKDPTSKLDLVDKEALKEVSKESKAGYITDERGNKIQVKPTETAKERIARERKTAMEKYRARIAAEDGTAPTETKPKATAKKATVKKAAVKKTAAPKKMTRAERSAANKAAHAAKRPAELADLKAKAKAARASSGVAAGGELKTPEQVKTYKDAIAAGKSKGEAIRMAQGSKSSAVAVRDTTAKPSTGKDVAVRSKGTVESTRKALKPVPKAAPAGKPRFGKLKGFGKASVLGALAAETVSAVKGSTEKDYLEIQRLENKLAALKGQAPKYKNIGSNKNPISSMKADAGNLLSLSTFGLVGKTRRERMDELNAKIDKAQASKNKSIAAGRAAKTGISPAGARSSSKINKTYAVTPSTASAAGGTTGGTSGGKSSGSTGATQGSTYVVKSGDTLSKIAKDSGVSLKDLLANNKKFTTVAKYKQGNMIWSGTTVKIPKK